MADLAGDTDNPRFRDDDAHDEPAITLDAFLEGQTNAGAVWLKAGDDARAASSSRPAGGSSR